MILDAAMPANSYFESGGGQAMVYYTSCDSVDLLCLTMQQATVELGKSEGSPRPIFIKHDAAATEDLKTIDDCLKDLSGCVSVTVQDLGCERNQSSGVL